MRFRFGNSGQASIELLAAIPLLLIVAALIWQAALAARSASFAATAARDGARAIALGRDPRAAAVSGLPSDLVPGVRLKALDAGRVRVWIKVPAAFDGLNAGSVSSSARFVGQAQ